MKKKYYAVAVGRKAGIYCSWSECEKQVKRYSKAVFKSFKSEEEAMDFLRENGVEAECVGLEHKEAKKICVMCSRPNSARTELCGSCYKKKKMAVSMIRNYSNGRIDGISNTTLFYIKQKHGVTDVFELLRRNPGVMNDSFKVSRETKRPYKKAQKKLVLESKTYGNGEKIPDFVYSLLGPTKEAVRVYGDRKNPDIIYKCKRCGETLFTRYNDYLENSGHDCDGIKSSGELIVEDFLKKHGIPYKTQRQTLRCINPETGHVMPYDFELTGRKTLIEVQGDQHAKFIPRFHVIMEGFEYQQKRDLLKREYAAQKGYKLIEIWYEDLNEDQLVRLLL